MPKILLVDDDEDLGETLKEFLEMEGNAVELCGRGDQALEVLQKESFDLIVLDWQLPGLSGPEVCRRYRQGGGLTRVLMLTGERDASAEKASKEAGADDYLVKPFTIDQLLSRVEAGVGSS